MKTFPARLLTLLSVFFFLFSHAAIESVTSSLSGNLSNPIVNGASVNLQDQWYPFPVGYSSIFGVKDSKANVVLRYDDSKRTFTDKRWQIDVTYTIKRYDATGALTTTTGEALQITYDPTEGVHYTDRDLHQYANTHKAIVTLTGVTYTEWSPASSSTPTTAATIPAWLNDVYLDVEIHTDRIYKVTTATTATITTSVNTTTNELDVNWNYLQGAESYDLEWLFIDVGSATYPFTSPYDYDWKNATRVNVPDQHYAIPLAYPKGILLVRVRGVGIDLASYTSYGYLVREEADWTSATPSGVTTSYTGTRYDIQTGLLPAMNWAYSAGFAEDGKRMDGAQFYDGMMRGREAVTTVNTDGNVIVSDGAFDFEGRPAVSFLPYAEPNNGIKLYPANQAYDCQSFDQDDNVASPAAVGTASGSGEYYNSTSPVVTGMDGQTPEAGGYPYSRVTYMSDGTNRPATSAAAGSDLKEGSGKETQYFYGTPTQTQLDRLFGNEVGYATHYKKNFVVDPNGVVSIAYIDQHGRVVATALAGTTPANLVAIDNPNGNGTTATLTDDLLVNNVHRLAGDGTESQFTLTVTEETEHTFNYTVGYVCAPGDACYTPCVGCKYDLVIMVTTPSGDSIDINTSSPMFGIRAGNISSGSYSFSATLPIGTYRVTKTLTLNQGNLDQVRSDYIAFQVSQANMSETSCVKAVTANPAPCAGDCHTACENHYKRLIDGVWHYYNDDGSEMTGPSAESDADDLIADCQRQLCDLVVTPDPCTVKYNAMLADMSPGGQYFDNLPAHFSINATTGMQTINSSYYSSTSPSYVSGDINGWLDAQPFAATMLSAINDYPTTASHSFTNWDEVRDNWDNSWASVLVSYHPEYCAWNYHCNWQCIAGDGERIDTLDSYNDYRYDVVTMYDTDGSVTGSDYYLWNPLNMTQNATSAGVSSSNASYLPYAAGAPRYSDPRFAGSCDITLCDDPSVTANSRLQNYLTNFYPAYDASNVFIGYYSVWYVALDPDNIATGSYSTTLSAATIAFFQQLHDPTTGLISTSPSTNQVTPYQFFRSVYFYYRELVIEQGFVADNAVATCRASHVSGGASTPAYDTYGYVAGTTANPTLTSEGYTILYPRSPLLDIYGDGCSSPSMTDVATVLDGLVDDGAANPDSIDNPPVPSNGGCSCQMLRDYVSARGLDSTDFSAIAASLNDELDVTTYTGTMVSAWYTECHSADPSLTDLTTNSFPDMLACDLDVSIDDPATAVQTNCEQENNELALYNANATYQQLLTNAANTYMNAYTAHCVNEAVETFTVSYDLHEYYYTLYYYDQAGNLVKTVPPEGVNVITSTVTLTDVKNYRDDLRDHNYNTTTASFTVPAHDMKSYYSYNSLQQPTAAHQNELAHGGTFESGETSFWYDYLGRLVVSQNSRQAAMSPPAYSYTIYDELGRIAEVGQVQTSATLTSDDNATGSRYFSQYNYFNPSGTDYVSGWIAAGTKSEVTYTHYDEAWGSTSSDVTAAFGSSGQENLRNRVSAVVYDDDPSTTHDLYGFSVAGQPGHLSAYYYSYDVHGNVKTAVQETPPLKIHNQNVKKTSYEYDLVSGNVNAVYYQQGERDEFDHKYEYDADNRLHASYSSRDGVNWEKESKQFYYATGGMGRVEIGDKTVQGLDYVHTINGWLKGMNRNTIGNYGSYQSRDVGQDGVAAASNLNENIATDAAGFTLDYFAGDYSPVSSSIAFEADKTSTAYGSAILAQYNGNIAGMVTAEQDNAQQGAEVQGRAFTYDVLYRIKQSLAFHMDAGALSSNTWQALYSQDNRYKENFSYDWNGNITSVQRYSGDLSSGTAIKSDDLTYHYATNSNLLTYIHDAQSACTYDDDLDDQSAANYSYDAIGAMIGDVSERITGIDWNPYGKMKAVHKDQSNNTNACTSSEYADADVEYLYTASQQRLCKIVKPHTPGGGSIRNQDNWKYTWYAYDAGGQLMAVYNHSFEAVGTGWTAHFNVAEHDVYGSGRLGIRKGDSDGQYHQDVSGTISGGMFISMTLSNPSAPLARTHYSREIGCKQYEIANHLGNVLATVSDKRLLYSTSPSTATQVSWYTPDVLSFSDYYAFGAPETGRSGGDAYRYGFNGKENDDEVKDVAGSFQDYGMRMYDPRVGRFFSSDPLKFSYPHYTPYQFAGNKPITSIDLDGCEEAGRVKQGAATGNETDVNGNSITLPAGAYNVYVNSGSTITTAQGTTHTVTPGSVAAYQLPNGSWQVATWNNGTFEGYEDPFPSTPPPSSTVKKPIEPPQPISSKEAPVLVEISMEVASYAPSDLPQITGGDMHGHLPTQEELFGGDHSALPGAGWGNFSQTWGKGLNQFADFGEKFTYGAVAVILTGGVILEAGGVTLFATEGTKIAIFSSDLAWQSCAARGLIDFGAQWTAKGDIRQVDMVDVGFSAFLSPGASAWFGSLLDYKLSAGGPQMAFINKDAEASFIDFGCKYAFGGNGLGKLTKMPTDGFEVSPYFKAIGNAAFNAPVNYGGKRVNMYLKE